MTQPFLVSVFVAEEKGTATKEFGGQDNPSKYLLSTRYQVLSEVPGNALETKDMKRSRCSIWSLSDLQTSDDTVR